MTDISKAAHYRSFYEVAQMLDDTDRLAFYDTIDALRFEGDVDMSALSFNVRMAITAIRPVIEADVDRKNGGAPDGNTNASKGATCRKCTKRNYCSHAGEVDASNCDEYNEKGQNNRAKTTQNNRAKTTSQNNLETIGPKQAKTNNVNVNDNVNVYVNDNEEGNNVVLALSGDTLPAPQIYTPETSQAQTNYAKQIFDKFTAAGLPNANGNFFSFLQQEFKNSHSKLSMLHSDDVLKAVDNYIELLRDPDSYVSFRYSFEAFVNSKLFAQCLPANFYKDNFITYEAANRKETKPREQPKKEKPADKLSACVECGHSLDTNNKLDGFSYYCPGCMNSYRFNTKANKWQLDTPA